jgi:hypothetical protein
MALADEIAALRAATGIVHRDREWPRKVVIGGTLWLSLVGYPLVEGFQIESIENTRNGFPAPLPRWGAWGSKALNGIFAAVIDFFFFVLPLMLAFLALLCVAASLALAGADAGLLRSASLVPLGIAAGWLGLVWLMSASPLGKRLFVADGQPARALSFQPVREALRAPARRPYFQARLRSIPLYLLPTALLGAAWFGAAWSGWLAVGLLWLALIGMFYARLVVIQLYAAAGREAELLRYEQFQARLGR